MNSATLSEIQRWMMTVITTTNGHGAQKGLDIARSQFDLNEHTTIAQRDTREIISRLNIYIQGYMGRLLECLRADFPALRYVMGEDLFDFFAKTYIGNCPSTSTTLFDLSASFSDFIKHTQLSRVGPQEDAPYLRLPIDLARLERARTEVVRSHGTENHPQSVSPDPIEFLMSYDTSIKLTPCLRLVNLSFPLIELLEAIDREEEHPTIPEHRSCFIAITRRQYRVIMSEVEPWQYFFLSAVKTSSNIYDCAVSASQESGKPLEDILAELWLWLPLVINSGFLTTG